MTVRIAPSILSANFGRLADDVARVERGGADLIHVDVMDGRFVPNITVGVPVVRALHRIATVPLDVHLMIVEPERHIEAFADAGAAMLSVHVEVSPHLHRTLEAIKALGVQAGVVMNPSTPAATIAAVAHLVDFVVVMSVNPGFSGQAYISESPAKVRAVRALLDRAHNNAPVEIDGGIQSRNAADVVAAGAEILVAGSAIYETADPTAAMQVLRNAALAGAPTNLRE
jgi:ribulose-phosphate 3-epimerase